MDRGEKRIMDLIKRIFFPSLIPPSCLEELYILLAPTAFCSTPITTFSEIYYKANITEQTLEKKPSKVTLKFPPGLVIYRGGNCFLQLLPSWLSVHFLLFLFSDIWLTILYTELSQNSWCCKGWKQQRWPWQLVQERSRQGGPGRSVTSAGCCWRPILRSPTSFSNN